ncbi:MAG: CpaF family protein [Nitrosarchaeum sp.]|nr:CpaF family protein [Nitrosarchaeum sp.]
MAKDTPEPEHEKKKTLTERFLEKQTEPKQGDERSRKEIDQLISEIPDVKMRPAHRELEIHEIKGDYIDRYTFKSKDIPITITVIKKSTDYVPSYEVSISSVSRTTEFILEKIRQELIKKVNLGMVDLTDLKRFQQIEQKFSETIADLIKKYFPDLDDEVKNFLTSYLIAKSLGLGNIELLMDDDNLEEIVINDPQDPVWVYHKVHGWLKTNIFIRDDEQIRHYASIIGRRVGRQITILEPLLDAHLSEGDRVNATLTPISTRGNTMTIRRFSRDPWTITRFLKANTISYEAAALIWMAMHYEMSAIIAGGTASGKTSALNCFANFFRPTSASSPSKIRANCNSPNSSTGFP